MSQELLTALEASSLTILKEKEIKKEEIKRLSEKSKIQWDEIKTKIKSAIESGDYHTSIMLLTEENESKLESLGYIVENHESVIKQLGIAKDLDYCLYRVIFWKPGYIKADTIIKEFDERKLIEIEDLENKGEIEQANVFRAFFNLWGNSKCKKN